jgi:mono/diheme cytochrome c family protein
LLWRVGVRLLAGLLLVWGSLHFVQDWRATLPVPPAQLTLRAHLPNNGGWVGEPLRVASGRDVRLTVKVIEGAHALRIAHTEIESGLLTPGNEQVLAFTAPVPGRYVISCTVWCGPNHWRMRTVLEVTDPAEPDAPVQYAQDTPRYEIPWAQLDIDAPHPAAAWLTAPADPSAGTAVWQGLEAEAEPAQVLDALGWPLASPSNIYAALQEGQVLPAAADVGEAERWALLAFLWEAKSTPAVLERGAALYAENCASCHGTDGSGAGFTAAESPAQKPDFRYAPTAAGASPMQLYAKIARGGMGTGMPNWGSVLGEDDLWAVTEYLYTFLFRDPHATEEASSTYEDEIHPTDATSAR